MHLGWGLTKVFNSSKFQVLSEAVKEFEIAAEGGDKLAESAVSFHFLIMFCLMTKSQICITLCTHIWVFFQVAKLEE